MTLLFADGFEGYDVDNVDTFWDYTNFGSSIVIDSEGRNGGNCIRSTVGNTNSSMDFRWNNLNLFDSQIIIVGLAVKVEYAGNPIELIRLQAPPETQLTALVNWSEANHIVLYGQSSTMALVEYTSPTPLDLNTWYYIELKWKCHATEGLGEVKVNEQSLYSFTDKDTRNSLATSNEISRLTIKAPAYTMASFDDIYVCDTTGSTNNDFLGDVRIDTIYPNGAGNHTDLTPSAGSNYECVDETILNDTDYTEGADIGDIDSYSYESVPTDIDDAAIYGIQVNSQARRTATADNIKLKNLLRTGSTDYKETTGQSLSDDIFRSRRTVWEEDPSDSNSWTQAKINACEFGVEIV